MAVDMPYEREVDREHAEQYRARRRADEARNKRRLQIKDELRRGGGVVTGERRSPEVPATERVTITLTVGERARIQRLADELRLTVSATIRGCVLACERRLEGRL